MEGETLKGDLGMSYIINVTNGDTWTVRKTYLQGKGLYTLTYKHSMVTGIYKGNED